MAQLKYCDKHNQVGFLRKPDESAGFAEIVDFLRGSNLRYALTTNPAIYDSLVKQFWQTATANTLADGTLELQATIDTTGTLFELGVNGYIYMLIERKYPLSAEVCKAMLDKKLQGGKPDEDCYKMLKMMEKQAGFRKHKDWLVQEQTALGKDFSNPLMADNLPKIVWLSTHHICKVWRLTCGRSKKNLLRDGNKWIEEDKRRKEWNQKIKELKNLIQYFIRNPISPPVTTKVPVKPIQNTPRFKENSRKSFSSDKVEKEVIDISFIGAFVTGSEVADGYGGETLPQIDIILKNLNSEGISTCIGSSESTNNQENRITTGGLHCDLWRRKEIRTWNPWIIYHQLRRNWNIMFQHFELLDDRHAKRVVQRKVWDPRITSRDILKQHLKDKNPPYKYQYRVPPTTPGIDGTPQQPREEVMERYATVLEETKKWKNAEAEAVQIILIGIDNDIYSIVDACLNVMEMWKAIERLKQVYFPQPNPTYYTQSSSTRSQTATRNKGKAIANSPLPTYESEPKIFADDEASLKEKEIDKLVALILMSFKKIYKPTNNNLRTSSNTKNLNVDNTSRSYRRTGYDRQTRQYDNQRAVNVVKARENVGTRVVQKTGIQCFNYKKFRHVARECKKAKWARDLAYHKEKMLMCKQEEAGIQLKVIPDTADNSGPIFDTEPFKKVHNNDDNYNVFANERQHPEQPEFVNDTYLVEQGDTNTTPDSSDMSNNGGEADHDEQMFQEERELLASLIEKMKIEINGSKQNNKSLKSSNKALREANTFFNNELKRYKESDFMKNVKLKCAKAYGLLEEQKVKSDNFVKPQYLKKAQSVNKRLYDIGCYNDNLALMLAPEFDETIRLAKESRSKLSDLIKPFDYKNSNNLYELFVPHREKSAEQKYFSNDLRMSYTSEKNVYLKEVFKNQMILLENQMDETLLWSQKCKSSKKFEYIKQDVQSFHDELTRCFEIIHGTHWNIPVSSQMKIVIKQKLNPTVKRLTNDVAEFYQTLKEEMVEDLKNFKSLENEVESLQSQLELQQTKFSNEMD
ncbi:hypothetical protein Tco_0881984 [Tanacetum coccineum]